MPERTGYAHGVPSWIDLGTTDVEGAKRFYGAIFGWDAVDVPTDQGIPYTMLSKNGKVVAGMGPIPPDQAEAGMAPMWNTYVNVDSVDDTAGKAVHERLLERLEIGPCPQWRSGEQQLDVRCNEAFAAVAKQLRTGHAESQCAAPRRDPPPGPGGRRRERLLPRPAPMVSAATVRGPSPLRARAIPAPDTACTPRPDRISAPASPD